MRLVLPVLVAVAAATACPVVAQPAIVPAEHRVYDWLLTQRVAGLAPEYRHETRPIDRSQIRRHLDSLATRADRLGAPDRHWLDQFQREFFEPLDRVHSYAGHGEAGLVDPDAERTLGYFRDNDWRVLVWGEGVVEGRGAGADLRPGGLARSLRLTFDAEYRDLVGLYTSTIEGNQVTGDPRAVVPDPQLRPLYNVSVDTANASGIFDQTSASLRVAGGPFSVEVANERLIYGPAADHSIQLSDNADYLPFVRLALRGRSVTAEFVHAALSSRPRTVLDSLGRAAFFEAPDRFLALHRLEVQPVGWFTGGFTEMVVYGRRGPELAYLVPLFPFNTAEHATYDRDNTLFSLEGTVRPFAGAEVYGSWLVDNIGFSSFGTNGYGNRMAYQAGARASVPRSGVTGFAEYILIDPYMYTHRFVEDGLYFNGYTHNGFGLGHPLGPNADRWLVGVEAWLPWRARARVSGRYVRKGRNPVDPATGIVTQVGGDVNVGEAPESGTKAFLAGDLFEGPGLRVEGEVEPARGVSLRLYSDFQWWRDRPADVFVRLSLAVRP